MKGSSIISRLRKSASRYLTMASTAVSFFCLLIFILVMDFNSRQETTYRDIQISSYAAYADWNVYIGTLRGLLLTTSSFEQTLDDASERKKQTEEHLAYLRTLLPKASQDIQMPLHSFINSLDAGLSLGQELQDNGYLLLNLPDLPPIYQEGRLGFYSLIGKDATQHLGPLSAFQYYQLVSRIKGMNVLFDQLFASRLDVVLSSIAHRSQEMQIRYFRFRLLFLLFTSAVIALTIVLLFRMNRSLQKLAETTRTELISAQTHLSEVQDFLDSAQYQQSLFEMVAGLSHELNTPLGNCMSISTHLESLSHELARAIRSGTLSQTAFERGMKESAEGFSLMSQSIEQMRKQIETFRRLSTVNHEQEGSRVSLGDYLDNELPRIAHTVAPALQLETRCAGVHELYIHYGYLDSLVMPLLQNSKEHGEATTVLLEADIEGDSLVLRFRDNGRGVDAQAHGRLAEPFFTTARTRGHMGLGLSIISSLVCNKLKGSIDFTPLAPGLLVTIRISLANI